MKVVVTVKQVAMLDEEFELLDGRPDVDPDAIDRDLNEWDSFSLEAALELSEQSDEESEVVVITVGAGETDEALRACLAKGADRAVRVWNDALDGGDSLIAARVLAAAVEREAPSLVLCGVQSSDTASGSTGVALAAHLGLPRVAVVSAIDYDPDAGVATVDRELEGGLVEIVEIGLPALLTIQTGINEPRYANLRAIKQAKEKPLEVIDPATLGVDAEAIESARGSRVRAISTPDAGEGAEMLGDDPSVVARRIAEIVRERMS